MSEHQQQTAFFTWMDFAKHKYPELSLFYAIPNGGHRHKKTAKDLKDEGE